MKFFTLKKIILTVAILLAVATNVSPAFASPHDWQDAIGTDKAAHFAVSYVINDQLKRNCGMNAFWAGFTTLAIGAAKEKFIDNHWDNRDFAADCAGVLFYQIKF